MNRAAWLLLATVLLVAANLRPTVQAVGPLIEQIGEDTGLGPTMLGLLGALPLLMYALVSPIAHGLSHRFGMQRAMLWSLLVLIAATVLRSVPWDGSVGLGLTLWSGTVISGAAIAVANVLSPAVVKRWFPERVHSVMPIYSAVLAGTGALASGFVVPISYATGGWREALLATGALLPLGLVAWIVAMRREPDAPDRRSGAARAGSGIWRDGVAWLVALYMGFQASAFYMLVTWLSPMSISVGTDEVVAGFQVMAMQLAAVVGAASVQFVLRGWGRKWVPVLLPIPGALAVVGLMLAPQAAFGWGVVFGLASGAMFSVSLWLMADRAADHGTSAALSGMAQSVGYVIAGLGPIVFAALHSWSGGWLWPLIADLVLVLGLIVVGLLLRPQRLALAGRVG